MASPVDHKIGPFITHDGSSHGGGGGNNSRSHRPNGRGRGRGGGPRGDNNRSDASRVGGEWFVTSGNSSYAISAAAENALIAHAASTNGSPKSVSSTGSGGTATGTATGTGSGGGAENRRSYKPPQPQVMHLNVGGQRFATARNTLLKHKDSKLYSLFAGKSALQPESDGSYFLDRSPKHFDLILNYLRDGLNVQLNEYHKLLFHATADQPYHSASDQKSAPLPVSAPLSADEARLFLEYREVATEAHHYGLSGLLDLLIDPYLACMMQGCPSKRVRASRFVLSPQNGGVACASGCARHSLTVATANSSAAAAAGDATIGSALLLNWHAHTFGQ